MKYALDVNVGVKWILSEPDSDLAIALRDDVVAGIHELIAPDTFVIEAAHVLTRSERQGLITDPQAKLNDIMANGPALLPYMPLVARAIEMSRQCFCGVFDMLYVALAEREGCEVITADQRMINAVQPHYPFVKHLRDV